MSCHGRHLASTYLQLCTINPFFSLSRARYNANFVDLTNLSWAPPKCGALGGWNFHLIGVGLYGCCHDSKCEFELYKDLWNWLTVSLGLLLMAFRDALQQLVADWVRIGTHNWQFCSIRQLYFELLNCVKYIQIKTRYMSGWILAVVWSISIHFG